MIVRPLFTRKCHQYKSNTFNISHALTFFKICLKFNLLLVWQYLVLTITKLLQSNWEVGNGSIASNGPNGDNYCYLLIQLRLVSADVIFLIYLYQRWVYPVDKKRVNEFGFGGEDEGQSSEAIEATKEGQSSEAIEATKEEKKTKWSLF